MFASTLPLRATPTMVHRLSVISPHVCSATRITLGHSSSRLLHALVDEVVCSARLPVPAMTSFLSTTKTLVPLLRAQLRLKPVPSRNLNAWKLTTTSVRCTTRARGPNFFLTLAYSHRMTKPTRGLSTIRAQSMTCGGQFLDSGSMWEHSWVPPGEHRRCSPSLRPYWVVLLSS